MSQRGIRRPGVAGIFYPDEPERLRGWVTDALSQAADQNRAARARSPRAIIAPHAGYIYSGEVAASAYAALGPADERVRRVVVLGPAHTFPMAGIAASSADGFATPLGVLPIDVGARTGLVKAGIITLDDAPHVDEHSIEVQLPFVQVALRAVALLPVLLGSVPVRAVLRLLEWAWEDPATLVVVSTDLSHYRDYETASRLDRETATAVVERRADGLALESACGIHPLRGLVTLAAQRDLTVELLDLRNSGDTAGPPDRVVGYGAFALS